MCASHSLLAPFEYEYTMKRSLEDQEPVFSPQQPRRVPLPPTAETLQHRVLAPSSSVLEAVADKMQPSAGIQYSIPQGYQVSSQQIAVITLNSFTLTHATVAQVPDISVEDCGWRANIMMFYCIKSVWP